MPAPKKSKRPKARPWKDVTPNAEKGDQVFIKKKTKKMQSGGVVRGAGAATRGKRFTRCG